MKETKYPMFMPSLPQKGQVTNLHEKMVRNASKITGKERTISLIGKGLPGINVNRDSNPALPRYTTLYRQDLVFFRMKMIVPVQLNHWYI